MARATYEILKDFVSRATKFRKGQQTRMDPIRAQPHIRKGRLRLIKGPRKLPEDAPRPKHKRKSRLPPPPPPAPVVAVIKPLKRAKLQPKPNTVGYLCMAYNPVFVCSTILEVLWQDYPNELKTLYLLWQPPFRPPLRHDLPIRIVEVNVNGSWPDVWLFKLGEFCRVCDTELFVWMDDDDWFPPDYTRKALEPIMKGGAKLAWGHSNIIVRKERAGGAWRLTLTRGKYRSPIGMLVGRTTELVEATRRLRKKFPKGRNKPGSGALDARFWKMLARDFQPAVHRALRGYLWHMNTNTRGDRRAEESVDFGWSRRSAPGKFGGKRRNE